MKKLNDRIFDLMLEEASQQYVEQIAAEYPSAEELKGRYTFSPEFEIWVESVIQSEDNRLKRIGYKKVWKRILKVSQKVSISICLLFSVLLLLAFTVAPIRIALLNFVTEQHEDYVAVDLKDQDSEKDETIANISMPEEFSIINVNESKTMLIVTYENGVGETLQLERYLGMGGTIVDAEKNEFESIMIGQNEGYISSKNRKTTILFHDSEYGYTIMSEIGRDKLIAIAKGIID